MSNNETVEILKEILKWVKFKGLELIKRKITDENLFPEKKHVLVYYYSNGSKSIRDIKKVTGLKFNTIHGLWKKWINAGIAEPTEKYGGGRCKRTFELHDLGLELPKAK